MRKAFPALAAAAVILAAVPASAGTHEDWESFNKDGKCWASTAPIESTGTIQRRKNPFLSVLNQPGEGVRGSVSVVAGYDRVSESEVKLLVDGKEFDVLPFNTAAFTASGKPEASLIAAMRRGKELEVTWTDPSGSAATDRYSLKGFTAAKSAIDLDCR